MRLHQPVHPTRQPHLSGIPSFDDGGEVDPSALLGQQDSSNSGGDYGGGGDQGQSQQQLPEPGTGAGLNDPSLLPALDTAQQVYQDEQQQMQQSLQVAMNTDNMKPSTNIEDNRQGPGSIDTGQPQSKSNANGTYAPVGQPPSPWPYNSPQNNTAPHVQPKVLDELQSQNQGIPSDQDIG
jgi:hypothetical protein